MALPGQGWVAYRTLLLHKPYWTSVQSGMCFEFPPFAGGEKARDETHAYGASVAKRGT
jgi:hypothetical protein